MENDKQKYTRNFCIIAHIDHGKSTLADRLIELTGLVPEREMVEQMLDKMDIERERGITIKLQAVRLIYKAKDGHEYYLNMIDTPGHVDFTYEVSRSLAACEGAVLIVDATQGIQAQTLANVYLAVDNNLEVVPVINKIDLPSADCDMAVREIEDYIGLPATDAPRISAKDGTNVGEVLEAIVNNIPSPAGDANAPLKALIFDSCYDSYRGVIISVRVKEGTVKEGDELLFMASNKRYTADEVGVFTDTLKRTGVLSAGDVGYITASIKSVSDTRPGDTVTKTSNPASEALPGYKQISPMVYCGIYPADGSHYEDLKEALGKLKLNDASLIFEPETSLALGFGFRCGFLGLLHLEVTMQRLDREYDLDLITTAPGVVYKVVKTNNETLSVENPSLLPPPTEINYMEEPFVSASIMLPQQYVGSVMELCQNRRGIFVTMEYIEENRVVLKYDMPLNEIIYDFFDSLKSRTKGYASLDYELKEYVKSELVKLDIAINGEIVDALSFIVHADSAYKRGRNLAVKLRDEVPRQLFDVPIQAMIGGKIIARETVRALRKDVLAKCYGGDITRKKKLLEKQKEGKKRMRQVGSVEIPSEAFTAVLKLGD